MPDLDQGQPSEPTQSTPAPATNPPPTPNPTPSGAGRGADRPRPDRRVAVVAVHGVAKHPAGETQDAVADLLLSLPARNPGAPRAYESFRTIGIQIPLKPLGIQPPPEPGFGYGDPYQTLGEQFHSVMKESPVKQLREWSQDFADNLGLHPPAPGETGPRYTQLLLNGYKGGADGNVYVTHRLEGRRSDDLTDVDIYEVLWADIAKPNNGFVRFFLALFQLLFHLAALSRTAVDTGAGFLQHWTWGIYRRSQRYATRMLEIFVPFAQLLLLIDFLGTLTSRWRITDGQPWVAPALGAVGGLAVGFLFLSSSKRMAGRSNMLWSLAAVIAPIFGAAAFAGLEAWLNLHHFDNPSGAANIAGTVAGWLVPGLGLFLLILSKYGNYRSGSFLIGITVFSISFVTLIYELFSHHDALIASFLTGKFLLVAGQLAWSLLIVFALVAFLFGFVASRAFTRPARRPQAIAAVRTSRLALALPTSLFMLIALMVWSAVVHLGDFTGKQLYPTCVLVKTIPHENRLVKMRLLPHLEFGTCQVLTPGKAAVPVGDESEKADRNKYPKDVLAWSQSYSLPVTMALLSLALFLVGWWIIPSAQTERFPDRGEPIAPRDTPNQVARSLGAWLSTGLDNTRLVSGILFTAVFVVPALFLALIQSHRFVDSNAYRGLQQLSEHVITWTIPIALGVLGYLIKNGQSVLGIILDVDTYLRAKPDRSTPRALIFERYISTLRYLNEYRDAQGMPYDSIVIAAHSLGALITGDILHFLHSPFANEEPIKPPIEILTFGNPTRQLLNRFFPFLYDWVRLHPDNATDRLGSPACAPLPSPIPDDALPNPAHLGVRKWVSAYRSGDYVGRSLWLDNWYQRNTADVSPIPYDPVIGPLPLDTRPEVVSSLSGSREELCIGAGAHTHYMDDTAPDMAWALDKLI